jgi:hypothetical protein
MAKQIIILETVRGTGLGDTEVRHVFWFAVPLARRVPIAGKVSAYRDATAGETTALQDGSVYEEQYSIQIPSGTNAAGVRSLLESRYAARQNELSALPNPNTYYGSYWDGSTWTTA